MSILVNNYVRIVTLSLIYKYGQDTARDLYENILKGRKNFLVQILSDLLLDTNMTCVVMAACLDHIPSFRMQRRAALGSENFKTSFKTFISRF
jgi:hypothetical protein